MPSVHPCTRVGPERVFVPSAFSAQYSAAPTSLLRFLLCYFAPSSLLLFQLVPTPSCHLLPPVIACCRTRVVFGHISYCQEPSCQVFRRVVGTWYSVLLNFDINLLNPRSSSQSLTHLNSHRLLLPSVLFDVAGER